MKADRGRERPKAFRKGGGSASPMGSRKRIRHTNFHVFIKLNNNNQADKPPMMRGEDTVQKFIGETRTCRNRVRPPFPDGEGGFSRNTAQGEEDRDTISRKFLNPDTPSRNSSRAPQSTRPITHIPYAAFKRVSDKNVAASSGA